MDQEHVAWLAREKGRFVTRKTLEPTAATQTVEVCGEVLNTGSWIAPDFR
jgi:hypothetical protein